MKIINIIKTGLAVAIVTVASGCSDFLTEDLKSQLAPENTYTSTMGFEVGSTGLYAIARSEYNTYGENGAFMHNGACAYAVQQIGTDIVTEKEGCDGSLIPYANLTMTPTTLFILSYWNWSYNLIASANELLLFSEKNTNWDYPTDKAHYQAEARFFRAYAYRSLVYLYGDVPWVETIQKPFVLNFTRTPKKEVIGHIIDDLKFAAANLPENPDNVKPGKLTKWAALHLLSEMYNFNGDYEHARDAALEVINSKHFELMKKRFGSHTDQPGDYFSDMFLENNQNRTSGNRESIWVMQFEYKTVGGGTPSDDWTRRDWVPNYESQRDFFVNSAAYGGRGLGQITPMKWWVGTNGTNATGDTGSGIFESTDIRNSEYSIKRIWKGNKPETNGVPDVNYGVQCQITDALWSKGQLYPTPTKFFSAHDDDVTHTGSYKDRIKFRLAETYLHLAEAYLGLNEPGLAADAVNEVRERAKASYVSETEMDMDYLLDERIRELIGEESRRFTLVRTGKLIDRVKMHNEKLRDIIKPEHALWPIPQVIRDANRDIEFPQNPGYDGAVE